MASKILETDALLDKCKYTRTYTDTNDVTIEIEAHATVPENIEEPRTFYQDYRGRIFMAIACYLFSIMHLGTKLLGNLQTPVTEMLLFRSVVTTIIIISLIKYYDIEGGILGKPEVRKLLLFRGIFGYVGLVFFMVSVTNLNLSDAVALSFTIPIFMTVIAIFYLKEVWSRYDIIAIIFGVIGIIYITKPESIFGKPMLFITQIYDHRTIGLICALFSTLFNAIGNISIRIIGKRAHYLQIILYFSAVPILPSLIVCYFDPSQLELNTDLWTWWWLFFITITAFLGQMLFSYALQIDKVAKLTPLMFIQVIFAFVNDFFLFNFTPSLTSIFGAICVGLSIYISTLGK